MISRHDVLAFIEYEKYFRSCAAAENGGRPHDNEGERAFADLSAPERALLILASMSTMKHW